MSAREISLLQGGTRTKNYRNGPALPGGIVRSAVSVSPSKPVNIERTLHRPVRFRRLPGTISYLVACLTSAPLGQIEVIA